MEKLLHRSASFFHSPHQGEHNLFGDAFSVGTSELLGIPTGGPGGALTDDPSSWVGDFDSPFALNQSDVFIGQSVSACLFLLPPLGGTGTYIDGPFGRRRSLAP